MKSENHNTLECEPIQRDHLVPPEMRGRVSSLSLCSVIAGLLACAAFTYVAICLAFDLSNAAIDVLEPAVAVVLGFVAYFGGVAVLVGHRGVSKRSLILAIVGIVQGWCCLVLHSGFWYLDHFFFDYVHR